MGRFVLRRALQAIPLLFLVSLATFSLTWLLPGDPASAIGGVDATPEQVAQIRERLDLDDPAHVRYLRWIGGALTGDFGESALTERSVSDELQRRLPITGSIALGAFVMAVIFGGLAGVIQGAFAGRWPDKLLLLLVSLGLSTPNFWLATLFVTWFAVELGWFPAIGYVSFSASPLQWLRYAFLPMLTLAIFTASEVARQLRTGLVDVMDRDYVRAARARGLSNARVVGKHALKNAALPTITIIGMRLGFLLAGSIIIENIFGIPGLGSYALTAIQNRDVPIIQAVVLVSAAAVIIINLLVDIAYAYANPKVRVS
ncbi:MAG TPA: ABC transporter permease [Acidimicrobiales bacterium]